MRIAWFHSHLLNVNSGGSRFVLDYAAALQADHGHVLTLICDVASPQAREEAARLGLRLIELDTASTNSPIYWLTLPWRIARKRRWFDGVASGYDVVVNSMFPMNWLVADSSLPKLQVCYEPFAFFFDKPFLKNFKPVHRLFFRGAKWAFAQRDRAAVRVMDCVVTINATNVPKLFHVYGVTPQVVYAGIDTQLYHRADDAAIQALRGRHPGQPLLFHSTDLTGLKGSFALLDVLAELKATFPALKALVTVYVNDPAGTERFLARIAELELSEQVEFLGCLPRDSLPLHYSSVDFVCQPSLNQPASWPLKEALICGTPIIGGVESEEVDEGVNGARIDVRETQAAASRLRELFAQRARLDVTRSAALMHAQYSRSGCVAQLDALLAGLPKRPANSGSRQEVLS